MSLNFRRHYPVLIALVFVVAFILLMLGSQRVIAYTTLEPANLQATETAAGTDTNNSVDLFDDSVVHSIQIIISDEDYQTMLGTYKASGDKDYFHADVIIDGVRLNNVGLRLKGNASLMTALGGRGLGGGMPAFQQGRAQPGNPPPGFDPDNPPAGFNQGNPPAGIDQNNLPGGAVPNNPGAGQESGFSVGTQTGTTKIPLMIKFDEFVSGQTYQGHTKLSLRTYGVTYDEAMLEEPLTNYVFNLVGLPATLTSYAGVQFNSDAETLYVLSEVVDDPIYLERTFNYSDGILYKAEVGSSLTYVNADPSSYANSFSQETRQNEADMASLIDFMRFLAESDDATFESELPSRLDVDSFATYLAINNLLVNTDSMIGMDNNYYLYYDDSLGMFTLLYWDGNESMGGLGMGTSASFDLFLQGQTGGRTPGGGENILLKRFKANATFMALYEQKLRLVYEQAFLSGAISDKMEAYAALILAENETRTLINVENYALSVTNMENFIDQRMQYVNTSGFLNE